MDTLFDDTYEGPRFTYGCWYRPVGYAQVPAGWIVNSVRPHAGYPHGTVDYPRELTEAEVASYQLEPLPTAPREEDPARAEARRELAAQLIQSKTEYDRLHHALTMAAAAAERAGEQRTADLIEEHRDELVNVKDFLETMANRNH